MKEIRVKDEYDNLLVRDSVVIAFFCRLPLKRLAKPFLTCLERWLESAPSDGKQWCLIGPCAQSYSVLTTQKLSRARRQFEVTRIKPDEDRSVAIGGPQEINPDYWFHAVAHEDLLGDETNYVEIRFPSKTLELQGVSWLARFASDIAGHIPYDSGYASLGLTYGIESQLIDYSEAVRGFAFRHPGFDVAINEGSAFNVASKLRGAYWLTFVGQEALKMLGGPQKLRRKLDRRISMVPVGAGWMLQAGERPEPGDVNRGQNLPLLRSLAKTLEPAMHFNDEALSQIFNDEDDEDLERWERRFFAPEYGDEDDSSEEDDD